MTPNSIADIIIFQNKYDESDIMYEYYNKSNKNCSVYKTDYDTVSDGSLTKDNSLSDYPAEMVETIIEIDENYIEYYLNYNSRNDDNDILDLSNIDDDL